MNIFVEQIKDDYKEILKKNVSGVDKIKWFHKKKLYQQTLTYIESNGPKDWERSRLITFSCTEVNGDTDRLPSLTNMVNHYIGYITDGISENMEESHTEALDTLLIEEAEGEKYWRRNRDGRKRRLLNIELKNKKVEWDYKYKVEFGKKGNNENQLYKLIAFYKLIKMERNLFNHMDSNEDDERNNRQRMQIDKLDTLIDSYVDTCEKLCKKEDIS